MTLLDSHPDWRKPSWPELVLEIKKVVSKRRDIEWWTQDCTRRQDPGFKMRDRELGVFFTSEHETLRVFSHDNVHPYYVARISLFLWVHFLKLNLYNNRWFHVTFILKNYLIQFLIHFLIDKLARTWIWFLP